MKYPLIIFFSLFALYITWHLGRFYEIQKNPEWIELARTQDQIITEQTILIDICTQIINELDNPNNNELYTRFREYQKQ